MGSAGAQSHRVNSSKSAIASIAAVAVVGAGVVGVSPSYSPELPIVASVPVKMTAAASAFQSVLTQFEQTAAGAVNSAVVLNPAAALSPGSILQNLGLFLFGPGSGSLLGITNQLAFAANNAVIGVDAALYQVATSLGTGLTGGLSSALGPVAAAQPVKAVLTAVNTLLQNIVLPPWALQFASGGFGFQFVSLPVNIVNIVTAPLHAVALAVQSLFASLQGKSVASAALAANSVTAVPKTNAKTATLTLNPTASTDGSSVDKGAKLDKSLKSDKGLKTGKALKAGKAPKADPTPKADKASNGDKQAAKVASTKHGDKPSHAK